MVLRVFIGWMLLVVVTGPCLAQRKAPRNNGFFAEVGPGLLWNTAHGDRYVPVQAYSPRSLPAGGNNSLVARSSVRNTVSPTMGLWVHKQVYRSLWVVVGAELVRRDINYVFAQDTLDAHQPNAYWEGLYYRRVVSRVNKLEVPLALEFRKRLWSVFAGVIYHRQLSERAFAERLDGTMIDILKTGYRHARIFDPWFMTARFSYSGFLNNRRLATFVSAVFSKPSQAQRYWMDFRFGVSYAFGSLGT